VPGDVLRAAAALSVVVGLIAYDWVAGALFFLVLGGAMLARALALPTVLDVPFCLTILVAAWAAMLDWYLAVGWLDIVVHAAATGLIAAIAHLTLVRVGAVPVMPRLGTGVLIAALGVALATVWEFGEWFGHTHVDDRIQVGYTDTIGDLAAGTVGAIVVAVLISGLVAVRRP